MIDYPTLIITIIGSILLFTSYATILKKNMGKGGYLGSKYWLNLPKNTVYMQFALQLLAISGFLMFFIPWVFIKGPDGGILGQNKWVLPLIMGIFLFFSICWSFGTSLSFGNPNNKGWVILTIISLIIVGICSIIFIAGAAEENNVRWYILLGTIFLATTTVFSDAVVWNARYIKKFL